MCSKYHTLDCNTHCPSLIATASLYGNEEVLELLQAELQPHMTDNESTPIGIDST